MTEDDIGHLVEIAQCAEHTAQEVWIGGLAIAAVALRRMDTFSCERALRTVARELRDDLAGIAAVETEIASHDDAKGHK